MKRSVFLVVLFASSLLLCSCAPDNAFVMSEGAGFWKGLWHGLIAPIAFVISWFDSDVGIYQIANNGGWYDFGYLIGLGCCWGGGGGTAAASRRRRSKDDD
jgi:hypothetical protein